MRMFNNIGKIIVSLALLLGLVSSGFADNSNLMKALEAKMPNAKVKTITPLTEWPGMNEVILEEGQVFYASNNGRHIVAGDLIDLENKKNLTEDKKGLERVAALNSLSQDSDFVVFAPNNPKYTVTVFTDIDCGYCKLFHKNIQDYNDKGIAVRYLSFPRAGINDSVPSYKKASFAWCPSDKDRKDSGGLAKAMRNNFNKVMEGKVDDFSQVAHCQKVNVGYETGVGKISVQGTPAIVLPNGAVIPGAIPADKLLEVLEESSKKKA